MKMRINMAVLCIAVFAAGCRAGGARKFVSVLALADQRYNKAIGIDVYVSGFLYYEFFANNAILSRHTCSGGCCLQYLIFQLKKDRKEMEKKLYLSTLCLVITICSLTFIEMVSGHDLKTKCGNDVQHMHVAPDWTAVQKAAINAGVAADFPDATKIGDATKNYNCHSYCWAGSAEWIDNPAIYIDSHTVD